MMNFREELNKIINEKKTVKSSYEKGMTNICIQVLEYFWEKDESELSESTEILFGVDSQNRVYGRVYKCEELDRTANFLVQADSKAEAMMLLVFLEQKFKNEKFHLLHETSASRDGCFSVVIKV